MLSDLNDDYQYKKNINYAIQDTALIIEKARLLES